MKSAQQTDLNASTEEKIKEAARIVFTRKGYAATRTRDIAEESGYNLALINYYFRSKEKLFDIIMLEQLQVFVQSISGIVNDQTTTLQEKINLLVSHYIDMLIANPGLPIFIMNEVNANPEKFISKIGIDVGIKDVFILKQWHEMAERHNAPTINPLHLIMNLVSMTVFPFIASPLLRNKTEMSVEEFNSMMMERKKLIPIWIMAIVQSTFDS
ncbi:MAG: TetR/AcrR family transcriptional regulator [Taibaiella sp.]|nr:TetR/AcrR family transcriptional regulator [Taibaiella sp.]